MENKQLNHSSVLQTNQLNWQENHNRQSNNQFQPTHNMIQYGFFFNEEIWNGEKYEKSWENILTKPLLRCPVLWKKSELFRRQ